MVRYLRAANVKDGTLDLEDVKEMDFTPAEQAVFGLSPGDVLVTEGAGSLAAVGAASVWAGEIPGTVCFQNTLLRLRPRPGTDAKFLMWWARHAFGSGLFASIATGANIYHLGAERVRLLPVWVPNREEQSGIADYLDWETGRIDAIAARYRDMLALLEERRASVIARELEPQDGEQAIRLKFRAGRPTSGNRDHSFTEDDSGVPCLRGLNVRPGRIEGQNLMRISLDDHLSHRATELHEGDVVVVRSGNAGAAAAIPAGLEGSNCVDLVILRRSHGLWPRYMEYALNSHQARSQAAEGIFGATLTHFNAVDVAELRLRLPSLPAQQATAQRLDEAVGAIDVLVKSINDELRLLVERRQALITAVVCGEYDIPSVAA